MSIPQAIWWNSFTPSHQPSATSARTKRQSVGGGQPRNIDGSEVRRVQKLSKSVVETETPSAASPAMLVNVPRTVLADDMLGRDVEGG